MAGWSGFPVLADGFGNPIRYIPKKTSGQGEGPCRSTTQGIQILSGYQPQRRSDVNRGFIPHFWPFLNCCTSVSLTRSSCKDGVRTTVYCSGQEFFKKPGQNLTLACILAF
jgi:hypothetical protein